GAVVRGRRGRRRAREIAAGRGNDPIDRQRPPAGPKRRGRGSSRPNPRGGAPPCRPYTVSRGPPERTHRVGHPPRADDEAVAPDLSAVRRLSPIPFQGRRGRSSTRFLAPFLGVLVGRDRQPRTEAETGTLFRGGVPGTIPGA